jgi:hypothetical protein
MRHPLVYVFISLFFVYSSYGQKTYILGRYEINPSKKTIGVLTRFSESLGDGGEAFGERFVPDSTIDFDKTTLLVIGNQFVFKEHIKCGGTFYPELDLNSLRIIRVDLSEFSGSRREGSLCRGKNRLYKIVNGNELYPWGSIDISGYKIVNDFIYKKDNELYFLSSDFKLKIIKDVKLDESTLTHIMDNYFADKNGLYLLGGYITQEHKAEKTETGLVIWRKEWEDSFCDKSVKLEKSNCKTILPIIKRDYFIYRNTIYSPTSVNGHKPLPLNASKIKELEIRNSSYANYRTDFLADDAYTYVTKNEDEGYVPLESRYDNHWFVNNNFFEKNVNQWQLINQNIFKGDENTLYFPSVIKQQSGMEYMGVLVEKQNDFYTFKTDKKSALQKFNRVLIFNFDTQEYEKLDLSQYRYLSENLWIYKNRLYMTDKGLPVKEAIETENLQFITHNNIKTNYLTNDKLLIYMGNITGYSTLGEGGNTMEMLGNRIVSIVDFLTLKVIGTNILTDKENIYIGNREGITVIPIKALGLDLKIFTE